MKDKTLVKSQNWMFGKDGALFSASARGDLDLVKELVSLGADVNALSPNGFTPLHRAAQNGHHEIVKILLEHGANPEIAATDNNKPATLARAKGHLQIADLLSK